MVKQQPNQHAWDYMGWDAELNGEWAFCGLCKKYKINGEYKPRKLYLERLEAGKVMIK